jgi:hypothetical protein
MGDILALLDEDSTERLSEVFDADDEFVAIAHIGMSTAQ